MNVLLLSAGTREYLVRYFRQAISPGAVVAADADRYSPALYAADRAYVIPPFTAPDYLERVLAICGRERIDGVVSLIDPELSVIAKHRDRFSQAGVTVVGSDYALCELAYDKRRMYRWLSENGYPCARWWDCAEAFGQAEREGTVRFPVFVKPAKGSASNGAIPAADSAAAAFYFARGTDMLIQEFLPGQEIGADVYVDLLSGETVSIFTKKKLRMRAGETDRAVSFRDETLFLLIERFVRETGFRGPLDMDIVACGGRYVILDVNPRFGGGYLHAHGCGCDHIRLVAENLKGNCNPKRIGAYESGVCMMKYSAAMLLPEREAAARTVRSDKTQEE